MFFRVAGSSGILTPAATLGEARRAMKNLFLPALAAAFASRSSAMEPSKCAQGRANGAQVTRLSAARAFTWASQSRNSPSRRPPLS